MERWNLLNIDKLKQYQNVNYKFDQSCGIVYAYLNPNSSSEVMRKYED
jgi:hypothetical protein